MTTGNQKAEAGMPVDFAGRNRLTSIPDEQMFAPWVKAQTLEDTFLYWLPVGSFSMTQERRVWLLAFLEKWTVLLEQKEGLRPELFLQYKATSSEDLAQPFQRYIVKHHVLPGLTRRPGASLPTFPDAEEMRRVILADRNPLDIEKWVPDFCYWFMSKRTSQEREAFAGFGALTTIFLPPDPKTQAPKLPFTPKFRAAMPVFQKLDVDANFQCAFAMQDAFLPRSKQVFAVGLEDEPMYPGITFVMPLLESGHFFAATLEERASWFSVFDVYINESPIDKGIILAFQKPFEPLLLELLKSMREEKIVYPAQIGELR